MNSKSLIKGQAVSGILWWLNPLTKTEEILMTQRHSWMRVFPGYMAIPGGKVEEGETPIIALRREILEEIGLDLDLEKAIFHGIATTPETHPYRFETHYFSIEIDYQLKCLVDEKLSNWVNHPEFATFVWRSANEHLNNYEVGHTLMVPLLRFFIQDMSKRGVQKSKMLNFDMITINKEALSHYYYPLEMQAAIIQLFIPSKTLPPQLYTNCFLINAELEKLGLTSQEVIMIDPSPIDESEWHRMIHILEKIHIKPSKILCTHHHIDHCSFLHLTAEHFKVPVLMHQKTYDLGFEKEPSFWSRLQPFLKIVEHGEIIGSWKNEQLLVHHVPGHAAGQIAVTTPTGSFFIAGDLFQSEGSVVIGGRGSSMQSYMLTLKTLVEFNPKVLYPSHGIPVGSLGPIQKLLKHRLIRHGEIVNLHTKGLLEEEITKILYSEISKDLFIYAKANVESHLRWHKDQPLEDIKKIYYQYL